ncbi:MAG: tetratricopeptide (TPR) repeat protein [Halioglobus sp.]|jgi:tetratricopeptide (TPR) repeat protein
MHHLKSLVLCVLFASTPVAFASEYVGSKSCTGCHTEEYSLWQGSHHDLAMQLPTSDTVLGDFNNASFTYNGITSTFYRRDDKFYVRTDGEDGKLTEFPVAYVFGVDPLQQYLLPLSRGRWQALSIAWDARPAQKGGQRWYHLYPDEKIDFEDPLHWTGPYQNWNTRCAECHSTDLQKNYDGDTRSFSTNFKEIDVSCEACHGPGQKHITLANTQKLDEMANGGFPTALSQRGDWSFDQHSSIATRNTPLESRAQIDSCGRCHARRGTLGDYHYGADLLDTHRLSMPQSPNYYHDGQILDEVYVYGSYVQSKMHQAGVVCSNCHEPHSLKLRAEKNGVCAACHKPDVYDIEQHHHHSEGSTGAECANCHMPETTYMGVDPRRDHSLRIPRPDLSIVMGTPNACNQCHTDKDPQWTLEALRDWGVNFRDTSTHQARSFLQADAGDTRSVPALAQLAADVSIAPIWRANAMEALGNFGGRDALQAATQLLYSDDSMLRVSTVRALQFLPLHQRFQLLQPLMEDEITSVRMEVANSLAGVPLDQVKPEQAEALLKLFQEYIDIQGQHLDMPGVQLQLGIFYSGRGDLPSAEAAYTEAIHLNPQLIPAMLNLADLLRAQNRDKEARKILHSALKIAPEHGATLHALGLLETRTENSTLALDYLGRAAAQESTGTRHRFVYAIALHDLGKPQLAITELMSLLRAVPQSQEVLLALANYSSELGQMTRAQSFATRLTQLDPNNRDYKALLSKLSK